MKKENKYIKNNKYVDPKGKILKLSNVIDKGNVFITEDNRKICLTSKLSKKLKLLNESIYDVSYKDYKVLGLKISFDGMKEDLFIPDKSIKSIKVFDSLYDNNSVLGYLCIDITKVSLGYYTLDFLSSYNNSGIIKVMLSGLDSNIYKVDFISRFDKVDDNTYICVFNGVISE